MTWVTICPRCRRNRAFNHAAGMCYECAPTEKVGVSQMNGTDYPCPQCHNSREETIRLRIEIAEVKTECNRLHTELSALKEE
jgi:hypothetical protein